MIAIKDIKMPVNCEECFARVMAWCRLDEEERAVVPALPDESLEGRPEWCPLVEVPDEAGNCSEIPNNSDSISRQAAIDKAYLLDLSDTGNNLEIRVIDASDIEQLPSAQPETAKRIVGKSKDGMTLWYQCDMCNEPVDAQDNFCRGCGRRLIDG